MSTSRSSSTARAGACALAASRPCATCPSVTWRPTGSTGFSVVVGSWKIKPTSSPAHAAAALRRSAPMTSMSPSTIEPRDRARCPAAGRRSASDGDALARTGLADDAQNLVGVDVEIDAAHDRAPGCRPREGDLQSAYGQDRFGHADGTIGGALDLVPLKV